MHHRRLQGLVLSVVLFISVLACQASYPVTPRNTQAIPTAVLVATQPAPVVVQAGSNPDAAQEALVSLYQRVNPGIVAIQVFTDQGDGLGSGFVYDMDGHIVTNYHVVEGATKVEVDFPSGFKAFGKVVGTDLDSDLAVVKVDAPSSELKPQALGDSNQLKVGDTVVAIGNPFGLDGTMTVGIVSALGRTMESMHQTPGSQDYFTSGDIIQTDAAINPGNSGGPLLNLNGEVIGVNRAIRTTSTTASGDPTNSGIGFAVSINIAKRVVPLLIKSGKYDYPYLGITSRDNLTLDEIQTLGLTRTTGAYVMQVAPGGPADQAGVVAGTRQTGVTGLLAGGDLIIAGDGHPVRVFGELLSYVFNNKSPGDSLVLTIVRDNQEKEVTLILGKRP